MAIVLKYGAPGPILQAGYAAGVGHRQHEQQDDALKLWQQQSAQNFQAQQAGYNRILQVAGLQQQAQQNQLNRDFQAGQQSNYLKYQGTQNELQRDALAERQKELLDARTAESQLDREHRSALEQEHQAFTTDMAIQQGLANGKLALSEKGQAELRQLEGDRIAALDYSDAEQGEFQKYYQQRTRAIRLLAQPTNAIPYDERLKQNLGENYEQYKNLPWQFNNQGEMSLPTGFKMPGDAQAEASQNFIKGVMNRYEKNLGKKDEDSGDVMSHEDAQKAAIAEQMQVEQFRQQLSGGGAQAGQAQPVTPASTPPPPPTASPATTTPPAAATGGAKPLAISDREMEARSAISRATPGDLRYDNYVRGPGDQWGSTTTDGRFVPANREGALRYDNYVRGPGGQWGSTTPDGKFVPAPPLKIVAERSSPKSEKTGPRIVQADADKFHQAWATLSPGQSMRGPDGKIYIKQGGQ